jgi:diacylglycerol kinase family enzyme
MIPALVNAGGGQADQAADALRRSGAFAVRVLRPGELETTLRAEVERAVPRVLVAGGDGTIATAASVLAGTGVELAILPAGTLNHFAMDHGIPDDDQCAMEIARSGLARPVDLAYVNDRPFINTSAVGAYVRFVRTRDRLERAFGYGLASFLAACRLIPALRRLRVHLDIAGEARTYETPLLFLGVGERDLAPPALGARRPGGARALHLVVLHGGRRQTWRFARAYAKALRGVVSESSGRLVDTALVDHCRVEIRRRWGEPNVKVALDGEVERLRSPLEYRIRRDALLVVAPEPDGAGASESGAA